MRSPIIRKGIAFDENELERFDSLCRAKGYKNRSEAIRDLIRNALVTSKTEDPKQVLMGTLTLVYDHHGHDVQHCLTEIQHDHPSLIISSLHTHLDHHHCLEVLILKGRVEELVHLSDRLIATKGVSQGKLVFTSP